MRTKIDIYFSYYYHWVAISVSELLLQLLNNVIIINTCY